MKKIVAFIALSIAFSVSVNAAVCPNVTSTRLHMFPSIEKKNWENLAAVCDGSLEGNGVIPGTLDVQGSATFDQNVAITGTFSATGNASLGGTLAVQGATELTGTTNLLGKLVTWSQSLAVASNGVGSSAATATLTPTSALVLCACSDVDGCTITLSESGAVEGSRITIVGTLGNACTFADTTGVSETTGAISLGQWDAINYIYIADRWVETSLSNN